MSTSRFLAGSTLVLLTASQVAIADLVAGSSPVRLASGLISTDAGEYSPSWDSSRQQLVFMRRTLGAFDYTLYTTSFEGGEWSTPVIAPFSGKHRDGAPYFSPNGETLVFDSRRPAQDLAAGSINIWKVDRSADGWSKPVLLKGASSNSAGEPAIGADEFGPVLDSEGHLYFYAFRQPLPGGEHYISSPPDYEGVSPANDIPDPSNRTFVSYFTFSADNKTLVMEGSRLSGRDTDLFYACKGPQGWGNALPLETLNTPSGEGTPYLSSDGELLFFASDRESGPSGESNPDIYAVDTTSLPVPCTD